MFGRVSISEPEILPPYPGCERTSVRSRRCHMLRSFAATIVTVVWVCVLALTGGRFLALLAGANHDSELVSWLYRHSDFWVKPFFGMFGLANKAIQDTGGVFEPA